MKLVEVIELNKKLSQVKHLKGKELNYTIERNLMKLKPEIEILTKEEQKIVDMTKEFTDKVQKARELAATVDGQVKTKEVVVNGETVSVYDITEAGIVIFEKEVTELSKEYKNSIDEQKEAYAEFQKMLKEKDIEFNIIKVKFNCIPDDISREDMKLIFDLITEKES